MWSLLIVAPSFASKVTNVSDAATLLYFVRCCRVVHKSLQNCFRQFFYLSKCPVALELAGYLSNLILIYRLILLIQFVSLQTLCLCKLMLETNRLSHWYWTILLIAVNFCLKFICYNSCLLVVWGRYSILWLKIKMD